MFAFGYELATGVNFFKKTFHSNKRNFIQNSSTHRSRNLGNNAEKKANKQTKNMVIHKTIAFFNFAPKRKKNT